MIRAKCATSEALRRRVSTSTSDSLFDIFDVGAVSRDFTLRTRRALRAPSKNSATTLRMVLPPNITGKLHLEHARTAIIEDAIARHHRMHGVPVDWLPGFGHAGMEAQRMVEQDYLNWDVWKFLPRHLIREQFLSYSESWAKKNSLNISTQLKRLGATLNWKGCNYTLDLFDQRFTGAVSQAFIRLYNEGLIRREKRFINWCPSLQRSLSNQEMKKLIVDEPMEITVGARYGQRTIRVGINHRVRYEFVNKRGESVTFLEVATTRPETIFADVALAVHPDDARYGRFVGERVRHPLIQQRTLPVIADGDVQPDQGTGVLRITPAHDSLSEAIAKRHLKELDSDASMRCCIDKNGEIQGIPGYSETDRFQARIKVLKDLANVDAYGGETKLETSEVLHLCSQTGDVVESLLTSQWLLDTREMHEEARKAFDDGRIQVHPADEKSYLLAWLNNQEPWCLSQQCLWGHPIPAFRKNNGFDSLFLE